MPQASVKRLIEADKQKLIELVLDIEKYKDFIPYCLDSKVYERNDKGDKIFIVADLTIGTVSYTHLTLPTIFRV